MMYILYTFVYVDSLDASVRIKTNLFGHALLGERVCLVLAQTRTINFFLPDKILVA
jgi:hypothetical protein